MEEFIVELDDETADWLEASAADQHQSLSEFVTELIRKAQKRISAGADPG